MAMVLSGPVCFRDFGNADEELYKQYLDVFRLGFRYVGLSGVDSKVVAHGLLTSGIGSCACVGCGFREGHVDDSVSGCAGVRQDLQEGVGVGSFGRCARGCGGASEVWSGVSGDAYEESAGKVDGIVRDEERKDSERNVVGCVDVFGESGGRRVVERSEAGFDEWRSVRHEGVGVVLPGGRGFLSEESKGKNWKKNQRKSKARKEKRFVVDEDSCGQKCDEVNQSKPKDALRLSLEKKWALENELKAAKAARELELLKAEDLNAVKKLRERKVQGATERTMVQIEKAHASLVRSGDVPGVQPGFCQTVVDGEIVESVPGLSGGSGECSISPSSSISEREVRELKKAFEDLKLELAQEKKKNYRIGEALKVKNGEEVAVSVKHGDVAESAKGAFDEVCGNGNWEATGDLDVDPDTLYVSFKDEVYCGGYDYSY